MTSPEAVAFTAWEQFESASLKAMWELRGLLLHMASGPCILLAVAESQGDQGPSGRRGITLRFSTGGVSECAAFVESSPNGKGKCS